MSGTKDENVIRKYCKVTQETAKLLMERSKAKDMNGIKYIRYLRLNQLEHSRSRKIKLELMRMRNETNKICVNINQIVKIVIPIYINRMILYINESISYADLNCFSEGKQLQIVDFDGYKYVLQARGWLCPERGHTDEISQAANPHKQ